MRNYSWLDRCLIGLNDQLETCYGIPRGTERPNPGESLPADPPLTQKEIRISQECMRINHVGEVCAQALYRGQALVSRDPTLKDKLAHAAEEENDHLRWCRERLDELNTHPSYLNPFWYTGALTLGVGMGLVGDAWSLGFLAETEHQVVEHLSTHLKKLPEGDAPSRAIVEQMRIDEGEHASTAIDAGGIPLPNWVKRSMKGMATVMKVVAARL